MQSSSARIFRRRRRAALSCHECHRRKVKCDRKDPCTRCITSRVNCVYDSRGSSKDVGLEQSPTSVEHGGPSSQAPVAHRERHQQYLHSDISPCATGKKSTIGNENEKKSPVCVPAVASPAPAPTESLETDANLDPGSRIHDINQMDKDQEAQISDFKRSIAVPPSFNKAIINKTRVFGQSHWMNTGGDFQVLTRSLIIPSEKTSEDTELNSVRKDASMLLNKCKILARELKQDRPGRTSNTSTHTCYETLSKDVADQAIGMYMSCFESVFRIFHLPTLRDQYESYWADMDSRCGTTQLKIQLCLAIGSSLLEDSGNRADQRSAARSTISAAQSWFLAPFEKDRLSIDGLQIQCLLLLARQIFSVGGDLIWVSTGTLVHSAIQMGLNRDPDHFPNLSHVEIQIRRRLWATIIELSLQASLDAGAFPLIRMEDFDTTAPANINDEDLEDTNDVMLNTPDYTPTDTSLQRALLMSFPLRLQILRGMNAPKAEMKHETAIRIATELKVFCQNLQSAVRPQDEMYQFKHNMADFFLRRFILSLHHPFAIRAREIPQYHYSRKICLDAVMAMLSPPSNEEFSRLVLAGGGMFKLRLRHLGLSLGLELMSDIHDNGLLHTAYREMLLHALKQAREYTLARTGLGDTSARLNLLLSMVITRAELAGSDERFELKMVQSAKTALEKSFNILRTQSRSSLRSADEVLFASPSTDLLPEFDLEFDEFFRMGNWNTGIGMEGWPMLLGQ